MAQTIEIPINSKPYQNVEEFTLDTFSDELYDGFIDELGNSNKRPGLQDFSNPGTFGEIDGLYWWETQAMLIIVSSGSVFKVTLTTGATTDITGDKLETSGRVSFADNGTTLVMANGGRMVTTDGTTATAYIADGDAPTTVTHVAFLDSWLLANKTGTAKFFYADFLAAPTTWLATSVFTAESHPDNLLSLYVTKRTIILGGTESTEFWYNDGVSPFSRIQGTTTARGVIASYATAFANETGYFLDDRRRLVRLDGTTPVILSTPFDKTIQNFTTVTDVLMDYVTVLGRHFLLIAFPTENRTLVYDIQGDYWCEWSNWNASSNKRNRFSGNSYVYARAWNKHLFGQVNNSEVYEMLNTVYQDDGVDIHFTKTTGNIDHGDPSKRKRSYRLTMKLKTGVGLGAGGNTEPFLLVRWKDNNENEWSNWRYVSLKISGKTRAIVTINNLGSYYTRKWQFKMTENIPFTIGKAYEEVDINEF
jgi:hypothetical protein